MDWLDAAGGDIDGSGCLCGSWRWAIAMADGLVGAS